MTVENHQLFSLTVKVQTGQLLLPRQTQATLVLWKLILITLTIKQTLTEHFTLITTLCLMIRLGCLLYSSLRKHDHRIEMAVDQDVESYFCCHGFCQKRIKHKDLHFYIETYLSY